MTEKGRMQQWDGWEVQEGGYICIRMADSLHLQQKLTQHCKATIFPPEKLDTLNFRFGEGNGTPLQYPCLENPMEGGAWKAAVPGVADGWTRLSDFTFIFHLHALEKEMATHSSVLAWRIPGMG